MLQLESDILNPNISKSILSNDMPLIANFSYSPNGWYFSNQKQGFLPEIMERKYATRTAYKKKQLEAENRLERIKLNEEGLGEAELKSKEIKCKNEISKYKNIQMAIKIQLNSAYGAIGNQYCRWFDLRMATAITFGGQLAIRWIENEINRFINKKLKTTKFKDYVIASDTDSVYINMAEIVAKSGLTDKAKIVDFLNKLSSEVFEPMIDESYNALQRRMNAYSQKMNMKREVIASVGIWTGKKRYMLNVLDAEGVRYLTEPKIKIMGLEAVKSSTPSSCREAIKKTIKIILNGTEEDTQKYILEFKEKFFKLPFEEVAFPRGVNGVSEYTLLSKSTPIHVRGALNYNQQLHDYKLGKKYEEIKEGEKIKFCYLKQPNPTHQNVLSIISVLPKELKLEAYIDYDTQFIKAYLQPIRYILNAIGWSDTKINTLTEFFT